MRTVITYGTFDTIHYGHVNFLKRARALGDRLVLGLSSDRFNEVKGKKCYFPYAERRIVLEGLSSVDEIFEETSWEQKAADIRKYGASVLVMGEDWKGKFDRFRTPECDVVYLPRTEDGFAPMSSTMIKKDFAEKVLAENDKVDVVVTYVDDDAPGFREEREAIRLKFVKTGAVDKGNKFEHEQAFSPVRFRSWGNFRHWFRCVEGSAPWIDRVFLVVKDRSHVPVWLDASHPRLKIVCHDEFIPPEFLPTYNVHVIEMFYANIEGLSRNYITCNDDFFFVNPVEKTLFSVNGVAVKDMQKYLFRWKDEKQSQVFNRNLNNGYRLMAKIKGCKDEHLPYMYALTHLPELRRRDLEVMLLEKHRDDLYATVRLSAFRNKSNIVSSWFFVDMFKDSSNVDFPKINNPRIYSNSALYTIKPGMVDRAVQDAVRRQMVCFNDTRACSDDMFPEAREKVFGMLDGKFPEKCSFEI